jgi:pimeloyl-ACP methyl ester carboxylesterase
MNRMTIVRAVPLALAAVLFSACAQIATLRNAKPIPPVGTTTPAGGFPTESDATRNPQAAIYRDLEIASRAWSDLSRNPNNSSARLQYNYAVARLISLLQTTGKMEQAGAVTIGSGAQTFRLTFTSDFKSLIDPRNCRFVPADELAISGTYYRQRVRREGIGAPLLAEVDTPLENARAQFLVSTKIYYSVTAILEFQGDEARLVLKDPLASDNVSIGGRSYPMAADYTIGIAALLAKDKPQRLGFIRMIRPGNYADTARLVRLQPYDPHKIPVLMIHGLQDTPATWAPLLNQLRSDPVINQHYQFWVFSYPSGYPYPYSAELLREELDRIDKTYPGHKKIVLIGHSMGGLVTRLMVTDSGTIFWDRYFGKPPEQVPMNAKDKQVVESVLIFRPRSNVSRVIFCSTPHRGAGLATNWVGRLGIAITRLPVSMLSLGVSAAKYVATPGDSARKPRFPTSIDTLSPKNPFVQTMNTLPIADHVPYHSIIGDRGRGDTPHSSDGVVPYWSSHLDGAQSEKIVPSEHGSHQNIQGMEEIHRILILNLHSET